MRTSLERWIDAGMVRSPLQALFRRRNASALTILAYHGVDDPDSFARHLDWLAENARAIALPELIAAIDSEKHLPEGSVLITFDDGHRSVMDEGLPLLQERGLPAVVFVVAGLIGKSRPHWWVEVEELVQRGGRSQAFAGVCDGRELALALKRVPDAERLAVIDEIRASVRGTLPQARQLQPEELRQLEAAGVAVGNHTHTHPCLPRCSGAKLRGEIVRAHDELSSILRQPPAAFAYPNGDEDPRAKPLLSELGYGVAFLFDHRLTHLPVSDRFAISRVRVNCHTSMDRFRAIVSGLHPALHRARGGH